MSFLSLSTLASIPFSRSPCSTSRRPLAFVENVLSRTMGSVAFDSNSTTSQQQHSRYDTLVRKLYRVNLYNVVKMGLMNIETLHTVMGNPMPTERVSPQATKTKKSFPSVIHVAGTNGKGSTSFKIAKALELSGLKVGLFVSPHISSFRERIQVNGSIISEEDVSTLLPMIYSACEANDIPATFFEIATAMAFKHFEQSNVDVVVLETGFGGRLDSTNIVRPDLSVITSIGLEHTRILGDTIDLIGREKAGIMKKGIPVLVGPNCPQEVSERSERAFWKTRILAMKCTKWIQT